MLQVTILRKLDHLSVVSMIAVGLRPRVLVLELAPLGSLGSQLKAGRAVSRGLQHRIATQVAEGIQHLHSNKIIYRDLKPDNVLIFNLSITALVSSTVISTETTNVTYIRHTNPVWLYQSCCSSISMIFQHIMAINILILFKMLI